MDAADPWSIPSADFLQVALLPPLTVLVCVWLSMFKSMYDYFDCL